METETKNRALFNDAELDTIVYFLNEIWNSRHETLKRKDLGDMEREMYQKDLKKSKEFMDRIGY